MKKLLLTIGAVSCSCLIASAYTTETAAGYFSTNGNSSGVEKSDNGQGGYTLTSTGTKFTSPTTSRDEVSFSFTIDTSKIELETSVDLLLFHFDGDAAYDFGIGYDAGADQLSFTWGNNYKFGRFGNKLTKDSGVKTFTVSFGDQGTRAWDESGGFWTLFNLRGNIDSSEIDSIVVSSSGSSALTSLIVWDKDIDWVNGGATGKETAIAAAKVAQSIVPEPSAFGLLAGIGGLALVASRRRRK